MTPTHAVTAAEFVASIPDARQRADAAMLLELFAEVSDEPPAIWSPGIVGFGRYHYRYPSGREGETFIVGFSPRKQKLVLYLPGYVEHYGADLLANLGKHSLGKGCLYVKRLSHVDPQALRRLLEAGLRWHRARAADAPS